MNVLWPHMLQGCRVEGSGDGRVRGGVGGDVGGEGVLRCVRDCNTLFCS